jgi:hypothetical protein
MNSQRLLLPLVKCDGDKGKNGECRAGDRVASTLLTRPSHGQRQLVADFAECNLHRRRALQLSEARTKIPVGHHARSFIQVDDYDSVWTHVCKRLHRILAYYGIGIDSAGAGGLDPFGLFRPTLWAKASWIEEDLIARFAMLDEQFSLAHSVPVGL